MNAPLRPTQAVISLAAFRHNIRLLKKHAAPAAFMAVIKANAYGHGMAQMAQAALEAGADRLAVATPEEALALRALCPQVPIQVLGPCGPEAMQALLPQCIVFSLSAPQEAEMLNSLAAAAGVRAFVHVKADTGMGRLGFAADRTDAESALACARRVCALSSLHLEGVFTHCADADSADSAYTHRQMQQFISLLGALAESGIRPFVRHAANSAATLAYPQAHFDMVRPGISLYGVNPCAPGQICGPGSDLRPVMRFGTRIALVKTLPPGSAVSYGCTHVCRESSRIAVLPFGYADGVSRALSGKARFLVRGQRVPLVGRVCMDMCMADISSVPEARAGDEAILFGWQQQASILVDEVAAQSGTIAYESLCAVSARVPRVYVDE